MASLLRALVRSTKNALQLMSTANLGSGRLSRLALLPAMDNSVALAKFSGTVQAVAILAMGPWRRLFGATQLREKMHLTVARATKPAAFRTV